MTGLCIATNLFIARSLHQSNIQIVNTAGNQKSFLDVQANDLQYTVKEQQMQELPTGCEVTALTMVLNYYGYTIDKVTMATEGDPTTELGYIC